MLGEQSRFNALFQGLVSSGLHDNLKSFISALYDQLGSLQASAFKPEHQAELINLRARCRDLINQTRGFCDKAIPTLQYAIEQFQSQNPVDVRTLTEKVLAKVDPTQVLSQCEQLENKILTLNDRIAIDEYYKISKVIPFLCSSAGAVVAIGCIIGLVFAPVVLDMEMSLLAMGSTIARTTIRSIIMTPTGMKKIGL